MIRFVAAVAAGGLLAAGLAGRAPQRSADRVIEPFVMTERFEGEGLGQWASYPPAQDVGYEPSLSPTRDFDAPGGRALMRVVRNVVDGPMSVGFIKEVRLVVNAGAELGFAYRIEPGSLSAKLEIGIAGANGHRYTRTLPAESGAWKPSKINLAELRDEGGTSVPDGTGIEAVYVVAHVAHATRDIICRFLLDDVRLAATREASFDIRRPASSRLEPWRARPSQGVFKTGESIGVEVVSPVPLASAAWELTGPDGQQIARGALTRDGQSGSAGSGPAAWSSATARLVAAADPRGVWRLTLTGTATDGRRLETETRLLVLPQLAAHPRLFFGAADTDQIRARREHPTMTALWGSLQQAASTARASGPIAHGGQLFSRLDSEYLLPTLPGYFDVLNRARVRITANAAVGFIDNDRPARDAARAALLDVARWETWTPPWFDAHGQHTYYPAGQLASAVALAYDFLYDDLSEAERQTVRRALTERAIVPTWREYVLDNRIMADTSNWISHTVGGALVALAAIYGDGTPQENDALVLPLQGLLMKIEDHMAASFLEDGSYGEGISYLEFDLETLGPMLWALERVFGQSYWTTTYVERALQYPLHTLADPITESLDTGDTHPPAGHAIAPVVARSTDPVIRWLGTRFDKRTIYDFLFFDERVAPRAPDTPGSRRFERKGDVVFRSGWDAEAGLLLFRAGPTYNHNHSDQGSFQFRALGETLITEAGWSDYYKDPYYDTFFTQAAGHNTLLVDGNPASQDIADTAQFAALDRHPRITDGVLTPSYDAVGSDLVSVYRGRLEQYSRRLAYIKPDFLVVFDRVRARGKPAQLTWRYHVPARAGLTVSSDGAAGVTMYAGTRAALAFRLIASAEVRVAAGDGHIPYPVFATRSPETVPRQPAFVDITMPATHEAWLVTVLAPRRTANEATAAASAVQPIVARGWTGFTTTRAGNREVVAFSTADESPRTAVEGWLTDAEAWTATISNDAVNRLSAHRAKTVRSADRQWWQSSEPVTVAIEQTAAGVTAVTDATAPAEVRMHSPRQPDRTTIDGKPASARYDSAARVVVLTVPAGSHTVAIAWMNRR
jgi:hypothetical protein